ncbi:MAG: HAD family hydrolase [Promethearchaeota archaeon]
MSIYPIKAIVWDLDGTLIHFKIDFIKARKEAINIFLKNGVPEDLLSLKSKTLDNAKIARNFFESMGTSEGKINEIMQDANSAIAKVEYEAAINPTMVKDIDKVLEFAKNHNLKQAIFTYNTQENARVSLAKINLLHYFELIIGRDNIKNPKPHPDHLKLICSKLLVKTQEIVVIGDMGRDIEAALNVGAHSILIYTKLSEFFKSNAYKKADIIIKPNEIPLKLTKALEKLLEINKKNYK